MSDDLFSYDDFRPPEYRPVPPIPLRGEVYEVFQLRKENEQLRALLERLAQGEVISYGDSVGDPVYFCSYCNPESNEHEPTCPITQAKTLGVEVQE